MPATDTRGLPPPIARTASLIISNTGSAAMTAPKPTRLAVLKIGSTDASAPLSRLALRSVRRRQLLAISKRMAKNSDDDDRPDAAHALDRRLPEHAARPRYDVSIRGTTSWMKTKLRDDDDDDRQQRQRERRKVLRRPEGAPAAR